MLGAKIPPNFFYFFMRFLMVSGFRPLAIGNLAICREYQTSDICGLFFFSFRYSFRQPSYISCVLSFRASRLASLGV